MPIFTSNPNPQYPRHSQEIYLVIDFTSLVRIKPEYERQAPNMWKTIANRHRMMLRRRFIALSSRRTTGSERLPTWVGLTDETIKRKAREMPKYGLTGRPSWILRFTNTLLNSVDFVIRKDGYIVGWIRDRRYRKLGGTVYCKYTVLQLADIHHKGIGRVPPRPLTVEPSREQERKLYDMITRYFGHIVERVNRGR